jgi:hypothetical protein
MLKETEVIAQFLSFDLNCPSRGALKRQATPAWHELTGFWVTTSALSPVFLSRLPFPLPNPSHE